MPNDVLLSLRGLLNFIYIMRKKSVSEVDLQQARCARELFQTKRQVFWKHGVRKDFNRARQHSMNHYEHYAVQYGAPNGLDSAIPESKHRPVVKIPYDLSNKNDTLGQVLTTNQIFEKLAACRRDFTERGLLYPGDDIGYFRDVVLAAPSTEQEGGNETRQDNSAPSNMDAISEQERREAEAELLDTAVDVEPDVHVELSKRWVPGTRFTSEYLAQTHECRRVFK